MAGWTLAAASPRGAYNCCAGPVEGLRDQVEAPWADSEREGDMKRTGLCLLALVALTAMFVAGCGKDETTASAADVKLCAKCGQIKGSDVCCKEGAEKCDKCGLAKGSPGCCKLPEGTTGDVTLCGKCGQIKGTDVCCKADAVKCDKCGLAKGSPGCCKINKK